MASNKPTQQERKREFLFKIARRAAKFLKASRDPKAEMSWAERVLSEANLLNFDPQRSSPELWTDQVIAQNPDLMDQSMPYLRERDVRPDKAESFEVLIRSLVPSEGRL
jgi:hypothetical protein